MDLRPETTSAIRAVRMAMEVIARREDAATIVEKGGADFATGTDLRSEETIKAHLRAAHPHHGFIGEETSADVPSDPGSYWLVDPICGTRNFASRLPLYAINIALVEDRQIALGVVGDPASGTVYSAERGQGAWSNGPGPRARMAASDQSNMIVLDPGKLGGPAVGLAARVISAAITRGTRELRILGSALDLALLAAGSIAAVWHFSRSSPLHFAAGVVIAREAGAIVTSEKGEPWGVASEGLVAAATPSLHEELLRLAERSID